MEKGKSEVGKKGGERERREGGKEEIGREGKQF